MRRVIYCILQWTWGLPQNLLGLVLCLLGGRQEVRSYHGAHVRRWRRKGSAGIGMFIFLGEEDPKLLTHEYGHTVQSALLGPLFLPAVALPSLLWANLPYFRRRRREKGSSYYAVYPEHWASRLGRRFTGDEAWF